MPIAYPWYDVVSGTELEQGDILLDCPVIGPPPEVSYPLPDNLDVVVDKLDLIVMTQSCDLVNDKVHDVLLCPHWSLAQAHALDQEFTKKSTLQAIKKGQRNRYLMLEANKTHEFPMDIRIVDFGRVVSLPKQFVSTLATQKGDRLRLLPPYREHLSQAFARFFMRVGLPQDIELP